MFELRSTHNVLATLPRTVKPTSPLGSPRATEWERAPYSETWRPSGDDLATEPPGLTLSGTWTYATADEALADMARIATAVANSNLSRVSWRERLYCNLRSERRGLYLPTYGENARTVTHLLTLYPTVALTPELIAANQGVALPPSGGTAPGNATQATTTILINGVPVTIPVWRTNG